MEGHAPFEAEPACVLASHVREPAPEMSVAWTSASARSAARDSAMQPDAGADVDDQRALDVPQRGRAHVSTRSSVSGRGIRTAGVTRKSCFQKACVPDDVLEGLAGRAPGEQQPEALFVGGGDRVIGVGEEGRSVPAEDVAEEALGVPLRGLDARGGEDRAASATSAAAVMGGSGGATWP